MWHCTDSIFDSVGGAFAQNVHATWRWAFYINLCIGAVFAPVYIFFLPRADPQEGVPLKQKLLQVDHLGVVLNAGAFTALIMAISFGGNLFAWAAGQEITLWVVGGVMLLLFGLQQAFKIGTTSQERIFPGDLLRMPIMWLLFALMCAASTCVFVSTSETSMDGRNSGLTTADPHLLHPDLLSVRQRRLASHCSCETSSIYRSHGVLRAFEWCLDVEAGILHAMVSSGWYSHEHRRWLDE